MEPLTLKQARLIREKRQCEMAKMLNIHVQTYRRFEADPDKVTIGQAKAISKYLNVPWSEIFFNNQLY